MKEDFEEEKEDFQRKRRRDEDFEEAEEFQDTSNQFFSKFLFARRYFSTFKMNVRQNEC